MSDPKTTCPRCGAQLPRGGALAGMCAACMLRQGAESMPAYVVTGGENGAAAGDTPELSEIRRDFQNLEILELVGRGGMGLVYRARQPRLEREVALKVLAPELARDPAFAERFLREAQALAKLSHPNVVTVFDFGERNGRYFLVMEFIDGTPLRELLEGRKLAPAEALALVPQVCAGLQYAHEQGIVHRDIKPENILVAKDGTVKIADFGLVKLLDKDETDWRLTRASQVMGTPQYMAPEQMHRPTEVDHRADIYSLGVVLYEMLTSELPVGRFALPSERVQVDVRFDEVVLKALEREPERRFQRARDMGTRVEDIGSERQAAPEPKPKKKERWPTRRRLSFKNEEKWGGLKIQRGLVGLEEDEVVLEYRESNCFETRFSELRELHIPIEHIGGAELTTYWFGYHLSITADRLSSFGDFPQFRTGAIRMYITRDNRAMAEDLVRAIREAVEQA